MVLLIYALNPHAGGTEEAVTRHRKSHCKCLNYTQKSLLLEKENHFKSKEAKEDLK